MYIVTMLKEYFKSSPLTLWTFHKNTTSIQRKVFDCSIIFCKIMLIKLPLIYVNMLQETLEKYKSLQLDSTIKTCIPSIFT